MEPAKTDSTNVAQLTGHLFSFCIYTFLCVRTHTHTYTELSETQTYLRFVMNVVIEQFPSPAFSPPLFLYTYEVGVK